MSNDHFIAVKFFDPIKMPKQDFFSLPELFRGVFQGRLMVLASERGQDTFVPVELING